MSSTAQHEEGHNVQSMFQLSFIKVVEQLGNSFLDTKHARSHITFYTECHGTYRCYNSISNLYAVYVIERLEMYHNLGLMRSETKADMFTSPTDHATAVKQAIIVVHDVTLAYMQPHIPNIKNIDAVLEIYLRSGTYPKSIYTSTTWEWSTDKSRRW